MNDHFFISYSRVDGTDFALRLADELVAGPPPYRVWVDQREMRRSRQDWDDQLTEAIQTCDGLVFVMTVDSTRVGSGCKDEWVWALKYKKPVLPLLVARDAQLPFRLGSRQFVDFTVEFERGLAQLRRDLLWLGTPDGQLRELQVRLAEAERELPRVDADQQRRVEQEIEELRGRIDAQQRLVADPQGTVKQTEARIGAALEREREPERSVGAVPRAKFVNPPPMTAPSYFQDRHVETKMIGEFLRDDGLRMMSVVGRGGVGKTSMVCRLLKALENGHLPDDLGELDVDGIVYLSPLGAHPIDFAHVFTDICRLLPEDVAAPLLVRYRDPHETPAALMRELLGHFPTGRWVLLLDNFEDVVDVEGVGLTDSALDEALRTVLSAPRHGIKVLITTRVAPSALALAQPGVQRRINLDEGLPSPHAEEVLRSMDADGSLGIRDAPDEILAHARERTRGFPRALEALAAILAADRDTTLSEVLDATESMPENVVEALVGEAFNRLDGLTQRVMQALAIYSVPVPPAAIDYLLQPFESAIDSAPVLGRLVNTQFARRDLGRYYLHQVDRQYALRRVPVGDPRDFEIKPPPFSQYALRQRAADYFQQTRTPRETWRSLDDLVAQRSEFDLRCEAGDPEAAADVLLGISFDYLMLWGHAHLARDLHERLVGKLTDPEVDTRNLIHLGYCYLNLADVQGAKDFHERALAKARHNGLRAAEASALSGLGSCHYARGELPKAIEIYEQGRVISRELRDLAGEAVDLGNLGNCYGDLGEKRKAIALYEQALELARLVDDQVEESHNLIRLANARSSLGELESVVGLYEQALHIARKIGDRPTEALTLCNLADCRSLLGQSEEAMTCGREAVSIARETGERRIEAFSLMFLAYAYADRGEWPQAIQDGANAIRIADEIGSTQGSCEGRICLAQSYLHSNEHELARATAEAAHEYRHQLAGDNAALVLGVALLCLGRLDEAKSAFDVALTGADTLLARTADAYDELDSRALSLCGLALLENPGRAADAREAFRVARAKTRAAGVVARVLRLFDALATHDKSRILNDLRPAAAGETSPTAR